MKRLLRAVCLVLCWTLLMAGMAGESVGGRGRPYGARPAAPFAAD